MVPDPAVRPAQRHRDQGLGGTVLRLVRHRRPSPDALPGPSRSGIDLGLTHFAVLSDGTKIDSPRFLRRAEKKLKRVQQELSRKQKGSSNRAKAG